MVKNIQTILTILIIVAFVNLVGFGAIKVLENGLYEPNCWEEKIEGINKETGKKAFYTENFRCRYFIPNN